MQDRPPPLNPELAHELVLNAHSDLARVQSLVEETPTLVNCTWDWGGGDWETPLGAAAHMGRRDIALYLLDHGARLDLFAATMLGHLEIVRETLTAFPAALQTLGPHGIPLIMHARKGGAEAAEVLAYLESLD